jgi:hypothetical protein
VAGTHDASEVSYFVGVENEATVDDEVEKGGGRLVLVVDELAGAEFEKKRVLDNVLESIHGELAEKWMVEAYILESETASTVLYCLLSFKFFK